MTKVMCFGRLPDGRRTYWSVWADVLTVRTDGALVVKEMEAFGGSRMGFRSGGWVRRPKPLGDYEAYDVDFSKRFSPRKFA